MTNELNSISNPQASTYSVKAASTSLHFGETIEMDEVTMKLSELMPAQMPRRRGSLFPSRAVRSIPKSSKKHFVGELVFNRGEDRQRLGFASMYEHNAALCFIYRPDFLDIEEQLASLPFVLPNGKQSEHFFDFRVTFIGGRRVCISVKPERIAQTYQYRATMDCIRQAAISNICDDVRTVTERNIDPIELHNAKLFHSARDADAELDARVIAALQMVTAPVRICDFLAEIGLEGAGFRSVARAIRFGQAKLFNREKITGRSLIVRGGRPDGGSLQEENQDPLGKGLRFPDWLAQGACPRIGPEGLFRFLGGLDRS